MESRAAEEIKKIGIENKDYPEILRQIKNPPKVIYFRGEIRAKEPAVAIVGTRRCSPYGKQVAMEIAGGLAEAGITIVSGLAPGIDTCSHKAAVERGKRTIAVLGTGVDEKSIYPGENIGLAREIVERGGCLISEYPPGTPGNNFTFPQRNRIISGLSQAVAVIEAKEKSGSLITANYAIKQGKKLFAVPGPIHSLNSRGPHLLIKKGAKLLDNFTDILQELDLFNFSVQTKNELLAGTPEEILILETLKEEPLYIDNIIERTKLNAAKVAGCITILEASGKIRNLGGNVYAKI